MTEFPEASESSDQTDTISAAGDVGETWQVINRDTGAIVAECATPEEAWSVVDQEVDEIDVFGPDPVS